MDSRSIGESDMDRTRKWLKEEEGLLKKKMYFGFKGVTLPGIKIELRLA